jgi:hypothetical protein
MSSTREDGRSGLPKEGRGHDPEGLVAVTHRVARIERVIVQLPERVIDHEPRALDVKPAQHNR